MADRSPYTVKTLLQFLANLERREQAAQDLPDGGGELAEDPGLLMAADVVVSCRQLRALPDVQRILRDCEADGYTFDAAGMNQWVALVCKAHDKYPDDVGGWNLDEFCNLVEKPSKLGTEIQSTNDARDAWMYEQKQAGKTHGEIKAALERDHSAWDQLDTEQAVGQAIGRYCDRKQLPKPRRKSE